MPSRWLAEAAPPVLGGAAEASWIGVYAAATGALSVGGGAWLSEATLVLAALAGVAAGRWLPFGRWRPTALLAVAVMAAVAGFVATSSAGPAPTSLVTVVSALLRGLAVLRGAAHGDPDSGDRVIDLLMRISPVLIGFGWILGIGIAGPHGARSKRAPSQRRSCSSSRVPSDSVPRACWPRRPTLAMIRKSGEPG